ncbi:MAG: hypothetical protein A2360_04815 [Candidatus Staskawiczbacteria bacterium RIFOXYB1_FULL_32_11]|uniref:DUF4352 domain-containing protein n=1 Tax=Candidatus Staskawiczbacteria bacterium RIFOXYD1_FULL_32_13 TaxID=1802234 RepID=A0A1G2JN55_9BACT|nr:MAG: hypothetical protein UR22_C0001G0030 [Parcubacteria group bacterium GW2011_GWC2_32_10]OGZ79740.1 MAG: hypothetical protein A2360_04815 [Candidatus Staskawiczbacteria bacterium RIFOXYB1_FULL_32_11]OGZ87668.1 MAG: hypothetical protein A2561_03145 [Candidatus Staskawiczbacteria bacterium RIFOXYD1_FULL_32_13]
MKNNFNSQKGSVVKIMLALVIVCFVAVLVAFIVIKSATKSVKPPVVEADVVGVPEAVYEATINDIKITFQEATNFGSVLLGSNSNNPKSQKDLLTTEKFIKVTIGGQNKGKIDTTSNVWNLGNIIDSEGRNFIPNSYTANMWISKENGCGDILKPEFTPTSCSKIYEVSKASSGLKVEVLISKKGENDIRYDSSKKDTILLDLIVNNK